MKNKMKWLSMIALAVTLCACGGGNSDGDPSDPETPGGILPRKMASMTMTNPSDDPGFRLTHIYQYDDKGRVVKLTTSSGRGDDEVSIFTYSSDKVVIKSERETNTIVLKGDRAISVNGSRTDDQYEMSGTFEYRGNYLAQSEIKTTYNSKLYIEAATYTWKDGSIDKIDWIDPENRSWVDKFTYGTQPNNLNLDVMGLIINNAGEGMFRMLNFIGARSKYLPSSITSTSNGKNYQITYTKDSQGYITQIRVVGRIIDIKYQ